MLGMFRRFRERQPELDAESAAIDEILQHLARGMKLHKARSLKKFYKRRYQLHLDNMHLIYKNSRKPFFCAKIPYVDIFEVEEVRKGWKTDVFNDVERKFRRRKRYLPFDSLNLTEDTCFSLILSPKHKTLDLVAQNSNDCELWVRGLRHVIASCKNTRKDQEYERWLRDQFQIADANRSGALNFRECQNLLKQLNVSMDERHCRTLFNAANFKCHKVDNEDVLDREEFVQFYHSLLSRPDIDRIFNEYTAKNMTIMGPEELHKFLTQDQKMNVSVTDCKQIIEEYAQDRAHPEGYLGRSGFRDLLLSDDHVIFDKEHLNVCQDMNQPLNHYYIASSHNTYLVQGQLMGSSSVEGYIRALKKGCRCLELDVWDGPDEEPVVYHGYTLTTKILFRDVLDSVKQYAFVDSQYPIILSLENHCKLEQQKVMAKHLVDILGDLLHNQPVGDKEKAMPPPSALMNKVIVKGKKLNKDFSLDVDEDSDDEGSNKPTPETVLAEELSDCVTYCKASHFKSFEESEKWRFNEMASFSEVKATKLSSTAKGASDFVKYNSQHLSRIYPKGTRTDSSNYNPVPFWNIGCQIVALNYQRWDQKMFMNEAKFSTNGRCGYVLMPEFLRRGTFNLAKPDPGLKRTLVIKIISGQQLPKPTESSPNGEVVDPYVVVKIFGHPWDTQKVKTDFVSNNGFNPQWNEVFELPVHVPQLAMVLFTVKDQSRMGKNMKLAKYAIPLEAIQEGYRHIHLRNNAFLSLVPASLFVHISIRK